MKRLIIPVAVLMLGSTAGFLALAQPFPQGPLGQQGFPSQAQQGQQPQSQDDPGDAAEHGVARLSLINGSVTLSRGDSGEFINANINEPVMASDRVLTRDGSRAEIQFDSSSMIRIAGDAEVRMGDLQYHRYLVQIIQGTALFRVLHDTDARIDLSTPSVSITPLRAGIYRVTVRPDGSSEITVRAGEAELNSPSGSERLPAGETIVSRGPVDNPEFRSVSAIQYDEWDRWNADRDRFFERAPDVSRYAGPNLEGAQELANYGRWVWDPQYGYVWVPGNEPPDWAPYRDGRWVDVDYYGWSWVGYEPWGWAPYHYGNWYRASFGWAWYPGAIGPRRYWRPAMVGFFGFGEPAFGVSLGFGYGNVGWVPLAPFEHYRPWYGRGNNGDRNITVVNSTNIMNVYRNVRFNGAVTGLRAGEFGRAGVGRNAYVRPNSGELTRAGVLSGRMPFASTRNVPERNYGAPGGGSFNNPGTSVRLNERSGSVVRLDNPASSSGWRRLESQPGSPAVGGNRSDVRIFSPQRPTSEPVRISPPIVNNRYDPQPDFQRRNGGNNGRELGGFGTPPPQRAAPVYRAPQGGGGGGGYRGAPPSGASPPRGGGSGPRNGGEAHGGGHGR